jgi:hypothetical protein
MIGLTTRFYIKYTMHNNMKNKIVCVKNLLVFECHMLGREENISLTRENPKIDSRAHLICFIIRFSSQEHYSILKEGKQLCYQVPAARQGIPYIAQIVISNRAYQTSPKIKQNRFCFSAVRKM